MTRKKGEVIVADLKKRSKKGLELAKQILLSEKMEYPKLREALEHYLLNWDEFTHPGFFSVACETVGGNPDDSLSTQAAIAMLTAAFDVHDDIIDRSAAKNEKPTVYGKFGIEIALLLGNAFLIEGLELFAKSTVEFPKEKQESMLENLKNLLFDVGNAHALEVGYKKSKSISPSNYLKITEMKAASIEADMYVGALFGGGNETEVQILAKVGRILGILATLRDDLIDIFDVEELRQRISVQDLPLPIVFALEDKKAKGKILDALSKPCVTEKQVVTLVESTLHAEPVVRLREHMQQLIGEGLSLLNRLPKTKLQSELQALLEFMLEDL